MNLSQIFLALISGFSFGFLLRKAKVTDSTIIINQLLLKDFTVMKVILTAIITGSMGIYGLNAFGLIPSFHMSTTPLTMSLLGGGVFGIGMSFLGYCPGTALAALASGSKRALYGVLGMFVGAFLFNEIFSKIETILLTKDFAYKKNIPNLIHIPLWAVLVVLLFFWSILFLLTRTNNPSFEKETTFSQKG